MPKEQRYLVNIIGCNESNSKRSIASAHRRHSMVEIAENPLTAAVVEPQQTIKEIIKEKTLHLLQDDVSHEEDHLGPLLPGKRKNLRTRSIYYY